jgi:hypothetical protein
MLYLRWQKESDAVKKYQSKILRSSLVELLSIPQNQRVDVRDLNGNFSLRVKVGAIAVGGLYDGRIRVYGGSGSDEFSACWCFEIPFDVNDGLPEDVLEIDVYFYSHEFQIVIPAYC